MPDVAGSRGPLKPPMFSALTGVRRLDRKLMPFKRLRNIRAPRSGWLRAVRTSIGMSQSDLSRRLSVAQPTVEGYERAEASGAITLASLRRAADALDCDLVYALVPRRGLEASIIARARELAEQIVRRTDHSMRLEAQGVPAVETRRQIADLARTLASKPRRGFWRPNAGSNEQLPEGATPLDDDERRRAAPHEAGAAADLGRPAG